MASIDLYDSQETEVPQPSSPPHTNVADEAASTGVDVRHGGAATTVTSLDEGQGSGQYDTTRIDGFLYNIEKDLKQTKQIYGAAYTKIIKKIPACCDDDDDYDSAIIPILSTEEPIDSLSMGDDHLDTIPTTKSDEVIKSSVEDLIPIPSEFEENIEYVEASPHDSELVSLEAAEIVIPEVEEIEDDNLREKLLNVHLLIANIEALKDNPTQSSELLTTKHFVLPIWSAYSTTVKSSRDKIEKNTNFKTCEKPVSQVEQIFLEELEKLKRQEQEASDAAESLRKEATHDTQNANTSSTNLLNTVSIPLSTAGPSRAFNDAIQKRSKVYKNSEARALGRNRHDMEVDTAKPIYIVSVAVTTASITVSTASPIRVSTADDISMAKTLVYIRRSAAKDKGKGKMVESKIVQPKTKLQQEQERLGLEAAMRLQAKIDEEERQRIARVHETASSFNIEEWEDMQARVKANEELAVRLQAEERERKRNKPMTQAQQRTCMSNYIKNMGGYTLQQLRGYSFDEINTLFETTMRMVNTFIPMDTEVRRGIPKLVADSSQAVVREVRGTKRATEEELGHQNSKKQKSDELSQEELHQLMIIVPKEMMNIKSLETKYPIID
uniref:Reverse transcriptase domain-containing protein n=1 Tax=Tanacetum cinerariifolium TaxID=118510 RepID=A0A6L2P1Q7_TANCI|nr:hypothetical protein [Tanacetum cinerariifolium]